MSDLPIARVVRLTSEVVPHAGEMLVSSKRVILADEISTGLEYASFLLVLLLLACMPVLKAVATRLITDVSLICSSSTTYLIVKCFANMAHMRRSTLLMSLLQPPPETFALFDDVMLLSEGKHCSS